MTTTSTGPRAFGTLILRGSVWYLRYRREGKEIWESLRTTSEKQAERKRAERGAEFGLGVLVRPVAMRMSFGRLGELIRADYVRQGNALQPLEDSWRRLSGFFKDGIRALAITTDRVHDYEAVQLEAGYARATVNKDLAALRRAFNLAIEAKQLPLSAKPAIKTPDPHNARQGFFEEDEFRAVLAELPAPLRPVMEFCYLTGWRPRDEVLPLTWDRVDFDAGTLRLDPNTTKNKEGRAFPFDIYPPLAALLERQRADTSRLERQLGRIIPHVFHRAGVPIKSYDHAWRSACTRVAVQEVDGREVVVRPGMLGKLVYDFRRTAVRNLERAGVPRYVAMQLTGQKTEKMYQRYAIVDEQDLREGVVKLAKEHGRAVRRHNGRRAPGGTGGRGALEAVDLQGVTSSHNGRVATGGQRGVRQFGGR